MVENVQNTFMSQDWGRPSPLSEYTVGCTMRDVGLYLTEFALAVPASTLHAEDYNVNCCAIEAI